MLKLFFLLLALPAAADVASWYGDELRGRKMANGKPFDPDALTCASWFYPLGTRLAISNKDCTVFVTVTDRGPARRLVAQGRTLDLSRAAFRRLAPLRVGLIDVSIARIP